MNFSFSRDILGKEFADIPEELVIGLHEILQEGILCVDKSGACAT